MKTLTLTSNAKANFSLDILGRETTPGPFEGYHFIQTVLYEITPQNTHDFRSDLVTIDADVNTEANPDTSDPQITILCDDPLVPTDESNLAYKAAELIIQRRNTKKIQPVKVTITIEKHIPVAQGFGGGSSNAAATLKGLNELLDLKLSSNELRSIAAEIGMDVPFFIDGGVALGEHFGERITRLPPINGLAFTIFAGEVQPRDKTKRAYEAIDLSLCCQNTAQTEALIHAIKTNDHFEVHKNLHNDFEVLLKTPLPENHHLTGSGPGYFLVA